MRDQLLSIWPTEGLHEILDLGARDAWHTAGLPGVRRHVGVDIWQPALDLGTAKAMAGSIPGWEPVLADALEYIVTQAAGSFDAVLAIDLIEHLPPTSARVLMAEMARVARRLAVIWTTYGFISQAAYDVDGNPNPYEAHKWGPDPDDFLRAGYQVRTLPDWHGPRGGAILAWHDVTWRKP